MDFQDYRVARVVAEKHLLTLLRKFRLSTRLQGSFSYGRKIR